MVDNGELSPEARGMLPEAVRVTDQLYFGEMMQEGLLAIGQVTSLESEERNGFWRESAAKFPPFKNKILGLRLALNNARQTYINTEAVIRATTDADPANAVEAVRQIFAARFTDAPDLGAKHLLTTVLCSRITIEQGVPGGIALVGIEANAMRVELGAVSGKTLGLMTLPGGIEAVLAGRLHLARQAYTGNR